jgi:predicted DNA-binding transcriptional regulator YafY
VAKIGVVIPEHLRPLLMEPALTATTHKVVVADSIDMTRVRTSIRAQGKIALFYRDEKGRETRRVIWPFAVGYLEAVRLIMAWCEMRKGFRHFRTDRVVAAEFLEARYPVPRAKLRTQWKRELEEERARCADSRRTPITASGLVE